MAIICFIAGKFVSLHCQTKNNRNMVREVILVEVVTKSDMSTDKSKAFTSTEKAEKYFAECVHELMSNIEQDDIDNALDDGFWDCIYSDNSGIKESKSVIIKEISFEDD
jgi:hypothetical protein